MTNDTSLESSCALFLESANLQKLNFLSQNPVCKKKFEKLLTMPFQICKKFCKILNNLIIKKTCAIRFLMSKTFQKAKFDQNLTSGSGSKQRFSLLQEKQSFRQCG